MKKRIISSLFIVLLLVGAAVPTFAKSVQSTSFPEWFDHLLPHEADGEQGYLVPFTKEGIPSSKLPDFERFLTERLPDPNYFIIVSGSMWGSAPAFNFLLVPVNDYRISKNGIHYQVSSSQDIEVYTLSLKGDVFGYATIYSAKNISFFSGDVQKFFWSSYKDFEFPSEAPVLSDVPFIGLNDDKNPPPKPPKPPQPEPPPEIPYEPSGPPAPPVGGENLPYDPAIWEAFMWYIRDTIGSVGRVLLLVVFLLSVIPLVINTIRHYAGSRDDHGGNLL